MVRVEIADRGDRVVAQAGGSGGEVAGDIEDDIRCGTGLADPDGLELARLQRATVTPLARFWPFMVFRVEVAGTDTIVGPMAT